LEGLQARAFDYKLPASQEALMKSDNLRNFTVRFLESALRRVESTAKPFYGGRLSTGEAIRRLAEERLDEIESSGSRESAHDALLRMVGLWRSGLPLVLGDLRFLAECAHEAYQRCRRAFVSKELLVANVSAFRDAVRLATGGKTKSIEPEERYFLGNLGTSKNIDAKTLPEFVDKWIALLSARPSPEQAEFASRNLYAYLRDEEFPDESKLAKTLAQYVPALLQVAIRGYWDLQGTPLIDRTQGSPPPAPARLTSSIPAGNVTLVPWTREDGMGASIQLSAQNCAVVVRNLVDLEDLAEITRLAGTGIEARGGSFEWLMVSEKPKAFMLSTDRAWWRLDAKDFESFAECLESLIREPSVAALVERLRYAYGRI
jgi:hypothetical protein